MYKGTGLSPKYSSSQSHTDDTDLHPHHHDSNPVTADLLWSQQHQTATQQLPFCVLRNMKKVIILPIHIYAIIIKRFELKNFRLASLSSYHAMKESNE